MSKAMEVLETVSNMPVIMVGSRATCVPAPTDTDEDWIALIPKSFFDETVQLLLNEGCKVEGAPEAYTDMPNFLSLRCNEKNFILASDEEFFYKFLAASFIAKSQNLLVKQERIDLFQRVLYGVELKETISFGTHSLQL